MAHVAYVHRGGEDAVVENETRLLRNAGHDVSGLVIPSLEFRSLPLGTQLSIATNMGDHAYGRRLISNAIETHSPDVVHFHNLYPLLGPGAIAEADRLGCATVQTLHNYRLSCIAGTHFRDGRICEDCRPGGHGLGIVRGCYRQSCLESLAIAGGLSAQWAQFRVGLPNVAICLTDFMRDRLTMAGVPPERLVVKPNSVDASTTSVPSSQREGALVVGRLSPEKGISELASRWPLDAPVLTIVGDGPLLKQMRESAGPNVRLVGSVDAPTVRRYVSSCDVLVLPSVCFEGMPLVLLEALAEGTPVAAFATGGTGRVVAQIGPSLVAAPGDWDSLIAAATRACNVDSGAWEAMSERAVELYELHYSHARNLVQLEGIYSKASGTP